MSFLFPAAKAVTTDQRPVNPYLLNEHGEQWGLDAAIWVVVRLQQTTKDESGV